MSIADDVVTAAEAGVTFLLLAGWWLFSSPDPAIVGTDTGDTPRRTIRVTLTIQAVANLAMELCGIRREKHFVHFIANESGIWDASVIESADGRVDGFLASVNHPGSNMIGPGIARTEADSLALLAAELDAHRGRVPVFLVPVDASGMVSALYALGARNCELHFAQCRGGKARFDGIWMPTFMPETG